jgi:hypothetical protein
VGEEETIFGATDLAAAARRGDFFVGDFSPTVSGFVALALALVVFASADLPTALFPREVAGFFSSVFSGSFFDRGTISGVLLTAPHQLWRGHITLKQRVLHAFKNLVFRV